MSSYATLFTFSLVAVAFAAVSMIASSLLRPRIDEDTKLSTYECGMDAIGTTEVKTNIRFYVFALLFVIFDVETLFVYPWAVVVSEPLIKKVALIEMFIFLGILFLGLIYAWGKGALQWDVPEKKEAA